MDNLVTEIEEKLKTTAENADNSGPGVIVGITMSLAKETLETVNSGLHTLDSAIEAAGADDRPVLDKVSGLVHSAANEIGEGLVNISMELFF